MERIVNPRGTRGFTLVELLVVMAIIAILASIVVPNVAKYITQSRMTNALSEIKNADTAFTGMLAAAQVSSFRDFFNADAPAWMNLRPLPLNEQVLRAQEMYTEAFYLLLRYGKDAPNRVDPSFINGLGFNTDVTAKLGTSSMEIDKDPWGNLYQVYAGPWRMPQGGGVWDNRFPPFRVRKLDTGIPGNTSREILPAQEPVLAEKEDDKVTYFAPKDLPIYIYSKGQDKLPGQSLLGSFNGYGTLDANGAIVTITDAAVVGGADDISNWDSEQSYDELY